MSKNDISSYEKVRISIYDILIGFYWVALTYAFAIFRCEIQVDKLLLWGFLAIGVIFALLPFIRTRDIRERRLGLEELHINKVWTLPIALFIILSALPLSVLQYMKDVEAYQTLSIMAGSLFFGLSVHFFGTGNTVYAVAFNCNDSLSPVLKRAGAITIRGASVSILGGITLIICGVLFRYDLSSFGLGEPYTLYLLERGLSIFGNSSFLWGVLQNASVSRWFELG